MADAALEHRDFRADGVRLHVVMAGPADGHPVMLLHGFPDFWMGWRNQISALADAGFRVIVPDQRGYNTSEKPSALKAYELHSLVADVAALADTLRLERFSLVGHDWGGIVAWACGSLLAERLERLAILNAPHPEALGPYAKRHPTQLLRSSYVGLFQIPALPERLLTARHCTALVRATKGAAREEAFSAAEMNFYKQAWKQRGALTGMLNWYRALRIRKPLDGRISMPTLVLWGRNDPALEIGLAHRSLAFCDAGEIITFDDAGHWVQRDEADAVNRALLDFLPGHVR